MSEVRMCCAAVDPAVARTEQRSACYLLAMNLGQAFSLSDPLFFCSLTLMSCLMATGIFLTFPQVLH